MAKRSHGVLQTWFRSFAKELYEKANIDITRPEDLCRIKNYYFKEWRDDDLLQPKGNFLYALIPHDEDGYDNPPPSVTQPDAYLDWITDNLQVPTTDDQIEKLMEMSMAGTLIVFVPKVNSTEFNSLQIYTDEMCRVDTSPILETMSMYHKNLAEHLKMPNPPQYVPPADASRHGLVGCPPIPVKPKNMNPSFLSMLIHKIFRVDNDYAKKKRYEKESATYDERFQEWFDALDDEEPNVAAYKLEHNLREQYLQQVQEFKQDRYGIVGSLVNGYRLAQTQQALREGEENPDLNAVPPSLVLERKEEAMWRQRHAETPQGQSLAKIESIIQYLQWEKRSKSALSKLLGHDPEPNTLAEYLHYGTEVYIPGSYNPPKYALPTLPEEGHTEEERLAFEAMVKDVAQVASFAALAHPDVIGANLREGFTKEESAKLNYSMLLQNVMTGARPNSNEYMVYLEPARKMGKAAMEAYAKGELDPLAELLRTSIRQTSREAAGLANFNSAHSLNTLYYIGRMYKLMENDPKLMEKVGFTPDELAETKGYVALHKTMTKALQAKKLLLEHSLYMRELTPEQMREAAADIRFASSIAKDIAYSYKEQTSVIEDSPLYQEGLNENAECAMVGQMEKELAKAIKSGNEALAASLQVQIALVPKRLLHAHNQMTLVELLERKSCENIKNLANDDWIKDAKAALIKNCNLDKITTMKREDLAELISHESDTAFDEMFKVVEPHENAIAQEAPVPVMENEVPAMN